ncbi:MAG: hypothetical protein AB7K24_08710 [Gemmataceae bacterium]
MNRCAHFQAQLLEYVYGLLDAAETATLEGHLEHCLHCQQAHDLALGHQEQLGCAARLPFPGVRFDVPVGEPLVVELNKQVARGANQPPGPAWFRWAVAAGILLMIASLGIPAGLYSQQRDHLALAENSLDDVRKQAYQLDTDFSAFQKSIAARLTAAARQAQQADDRYRGQLDLVDRELAEIDRNIKDLTQKRDARLGQIRKEVGNSQLHMTIRGPLEPETGRSNRYQVETRTLNQPAPATLFFRVVDDERRVVFEQKADTQGKFQLALPADLPLHTPLTLEVSAQRKDKTGKEDKQLLEKLPLSAPGYLTHVSTDRQSYRPGDIVRYRSLTLDRFTLSPAQEDLEITFSILGPDGSLLGNQTGLAQLVKENDGLLLGPKGQPIRGIGTGFYRLPADAALGDYTLIVRDKHHRFPVSQRSFRVEKTERVPLHASVNFDRAAYRGGQSVTVNVVPEQKLKEQIKRAVPSAVVDGQVLPLERNDNQDGSFTCTFKLPRTLMPGDARLTLSLPADDKTLTLERQVPLQIDRLHVGFYPEGGDLVAGVPNDVYFQAWTPVGDPASIRGRIVDKANRVVADVATLDPHQGRGRFRFTPTAGETYQLLIDEPGRVKQILDPAGKVGSNLPAIQPDGIVLHLPAGVIDADSPVQARLRSAGKARSLVVSAHCRGQLVAQSRVLAPAGQATDVELAPLTRVGGIYRITAAEEVVVGDKTTLVPRAERLVYRMPAEKLGLALEFDKAAYAPGEQVKLRCRSRDEENKALPSVVMLAVTEPDADAERQVSLPGFFWLGSDLNRPQDLEYADFLLQGGVDSQALDLLLATQGWRHFVEAKDAQQAQMFALNKVDVEVSPFLQGKHRLDAEFTKEVTDLEAKLIDATVQRRALVEQRFGARRQLLDTRTELKLQAEEADTQLADAKRRLESERAAAEVRYEAAQAALASYDRLISGLRQWWIPVLALVLFVAGAFALATSAFRRMMPSTLPYLATAACLLAVFGLLATMQLSTRSDALAQVLGEDPVWDALKPGSALAQVDRVPVPGNLVEPQQAGEGGAGTLAQLPRPEVLKVNGLPNKEPEEKARLAALLQYQFVRRDLKKSELRERAADADKPGPATRGKDYKAPLLDSAHANTKNEATKVVEELSAPPAPPFVVREFGYRQSRARAGEYAATLYWQPALVLENGEALVTFDMGTGRRYRILAAGHTLDGRLDSVTVPLESRPVK